ncbi:hypothetical protein [Microbacterium lacticum]|uniref:Uncharacterized protein n=1 Tax=Microbacterium lacticum TaxID=33885 RepID=A0A4Y3UN81_9MICO|nr:hypothetical protein [Microbacterium lacticum]TQM90953.1 hypothetical protein FHX68_2807 [Microbacterium lacticum]GEB95177.1 hypothetical protein MLA01_13960 [Microbacterium lacticum]GGN23192.1 hypothetical protein GCM10009724_16910 [Microbacterium lacticum]
MAIFPERAPGPNDADLSDEEYNKTGTFLYPPFPRSAQQLIAFYEGSHPTEEQLTKFADAYGDARLRWASPLVEEADGRFRRLYGAGTEKASAAHWEYVAKLEQKHPTHMNPLFARDIARAVQMHRFAGALPESEARKVYSHQIAMPNGMKAVVSELAERYLVGEYEGELI